MLKPSDDRMPGVSPYTGLNPLETMLDALGIENYKDKLPQQIQPTKYGNPIR